MDLLIAMTKTMEWSSDFILHGHASGQDGTNHLTPADLMDANLLSNLSPKRRAALRALFFSLQD
jgi:hypothetical protein